MFGNTTFIPLPEARALSLALLAGFLVIFAFVPMLISQTTSRLEALQLTTIEKLVVSHSDLQYLVTFSAFLGVLFSLFVASNVSHIAVGAQGLALFFTLLLAILEISRLETYKSLTKEESTTRVANWFNDRVSSIIKQQKQSEQHRLAFSAQAENIKSSFPNLDLHLATDLPKGKTIDLHIYDKHVLGEFEIAPALDHLNNLLGTPTDYQDRTTEIILRNPYDMQYKANTRVPVIELKNYESILSDKEAAELISNVTAILQDSADLVADAHQAFALQIDIIFQDIAESIHLYKSQSVVRHFQILDAVINVIYGTNDPADEASQKQLATALIEPYCDILWKSSDAIMLRQSMRALVLSHLRATLKKTLGANDYLSFEIGSRCYRALLFAPQQTTAEASRLAPKVRRAEVQHFALFTHELRWRFWSLFQNNSNFWFLYLRQLLSLFEHSLDWWVEDGDAHPAFTDLIELTNERLCRSSSGDMTTKYGSYLQLSQQAYYMFVLFDAQDVGRFKKAHQSIFEVPLRETDYQLLGDFLDDDIPSKLRWSDWPLKSLSLGGGYYFSSSTWAYRVIAVRLLMTMNIDLIAQLDLQRLEAFRETLDKDFVRLMEFSNSAVEKRRAIAMVTGLIEEKAKNLFEEIANTDLDDFKCRIFMDRVIGSLRSSRYYDIFSLLKSGEKSDLTRTDVFQVRFPKQALLSGESGIDLDPQVIRPNDVWGSLLSLLLQQARKGGGIADLDEPSYFCSPRARRRRPVILINRLYPEPVELVAQITETFQKDGIEPEINSTWLNHVESGVYVIDAAKLSIATSGIIPGAADLGRVIIDPWFWFQLSTDGDKAVLTFNIQGAFNFGENAIFFFRLMEET